MSGHFFHMESAYCEQLGKNVSVDEAMEAYRNGDIPARCEFRCADENCRNSAQARITCVCCFSDNCKTAAHFRNYPDTVHSDDCIYSTYGTIVRQVLTTGRDNDNHADINLLRTYTIKDLDASAIVDEYAPAAEHDYMDAIKQSARRYAAESRSKNLSSDDALRRSIETVPRVTRRLEAVVESCEALNCEGRDQAMLQIPGRAKASYQQIFRRIKKFKEYFKSPYIMYGEARIYQYPEGFRAFFQERIYGYTTDEEYVSATCFFSGEDLGNFRFGKQMRHELESFARSKELCCLYILGTHERSTLALGGASEKSFAVISPNSLADVVIKKRCVK